MTGTVLFTDLRSFTSFAESTPAERVIDALNRHFADMGEAVIDHGGTLVAYTGDGLMAAYGAPIPSEDHADRAVAAAAEMLRRATPGVQRLARVEGLSDGFTMGSA